MSTARERREQRQKSNMVARPKEGLRQIESTSTRKPRQPASLPPAVRWAGIGIFAFLLVLGVVLGLGALNPLTPTLAPHSIWLDQSWTYATRSDEDLLRVGEQLRQSQVGTVYAYVSSLKTDGTWSGAISQRNRFVEVEPLVQDFAQQMRQILPDGRVYAWIEVHAEPPQGYRLNNPQIHRIVADFASRMVNEFNFDGVLIDVKPIFNQNEDLLTFLRTVRGSIGLETPLAVSVPPDFTPPDLSVSLAAPIAPNTLWDEEYKQRVSLQADELVIVAYNSYVDNPQDYQRWVAYQIEAYVRALAAIDTSTQILLSIPNYASAPPAHDPQVENISTALAGLQTALANLPASQRNRVRGVALYTDSELSTDQWQSFRQQSQVSN